MSFSSTSSAVYALPGFLGSTSDWGGFDPKDLGVDFLTPVTLSPTLSLEEWGETFLPAPETQNILMGYSLGGRLGLHAVCANPPLWKAAIFISTHPGLATQKQKEERIKNDRIWANRFLEEDWEKLMEAWNCQPPLRTSKPLLRNETDYNRKDLALILETWSLGLQKNFAPLLAKLDLPILWLTGENDAAFLSLAQTLEFSHPLSSIQIIPGGGHRIFSDQPEVFRCCVQSWLKTVLCV